MDEELFWALINDGVPPSQAVAIASIQNVRELDKASASILIEMTTDDTGRRTLHDLPGVFPAGSDLRDVAKFFLSDEGKDWVDTAVQEQALVQEALANYEDLFHEVNLMAPVDAPFAESPERKTAVDKLLQYARVLGLDTVGPELPSAMKRDDFVPDTLLTQAKLGAQGPTQTAQARNYPSSTVGQQGPTPQEGAFEATLRQGVFDPSKGGVVQQREDPQYERYYQTQRARAAGIRFGSQPVERVSRYKEAEKGSALAGSAGYQQFRRFAPTTVGPQFTLNRKGKETIDLPEVFQGRSPRGRGERPYLQRPRVRKLTRG